MSLQFLNELFCVDLLHTVRVWLCFHSGRSYFVCRVDETGSNESNITISKVGEYFIKRGVAWIFLVFIFFPSKIKSLFITLRCCLNNEINLQLRKSLFDELMLYIFVVFACCFANYNLFRAIHRYTNI